MKNGSIELRLCRLCLLWMIVILVNGCAEGESKVVAKVDTTSAQHSETNLSNFQFTLKVSERKNDCDVKDVVVNIIVDYCRDATINLFGSEQATTECGTTTQEARLNSLDAGKTVSKTFNQKAVDGNGSIRGIEVGEIEWEATGSCLNTFCRNNMFQDDFWGTDC